MVSEADLIRDLVPADPRAHEVPTEGQLARPTPSGRRRDDGTRRHGAVPETDLADAVELITTTSVKSVPVVDHDQRVVGMLSRSDVVRVLARADDDLAREVDAMLASLGLGDWLADVTDGTVALTGSRRSPRTEPWPTSSPAPSPESSRSTAD